MKNNKTASSNNLLKITVIASVVIVLLLIIVLTYIFWYQNPNKVAKDAMLNAIAAKNFTTDGNTIVTLSNKENDKIMIKINSETSGKNSQAKIVVSANKLLPNVEAKAQVRLTTDGALYFNIENLSDTVSKAANAYVDNIKQEYKKNHRNLSDQDMQIIEESINKQLDDIKKSFSGLDNKWIRFSIKDIVGGEDGKTASCQFEQLDRIKTDSSVRGEIGDIFKDNQFIMLETNKDLKSKGNAKPYMIKYDKDKLGKFRKEFKKSDFVNSINKKCGDKNNIDSSKDDDIFSDSGKNKSEPKVNVWIDRFSHKVASFEVKTKYSDWDVDFKSDIKYGNAPNYIKIPSDEESVSFKKVVEDMNKSAAQQTQ